MGSNDPQVLIAGGGPVGLLCAWLLGRQGVRVRVFDNNDGLQDDPRAATTHPATLDLLSEDGLADDMARVGLVAPIFQFWDRPSGELVAQFDHAILARDTAHPFVVQCEQFKTAKLVLERLGKIPNVEVLFGHEVVDVTQRGGAASVDVRGPDGLRTHTGAWLIGAEGGRSVVRKQSAIAFDGSPGRSASSCSPRPMISRPTAAIARAAISPTRKPGAIASRFRPTVRPACGARCFRPIRRTPKSSS